MKKNEITVANKNNSLFSLGKKAKKKTFGKKGSNTNVRIAATADGISLKPDGLHIKNPKWGLEINKNKKK